MYEALINIAGAHVRILRPLIQQLLQACCAVFANAVNTFSVRQMAIEVLVTIAGWSSTLSIDITLHSNALLF